MPIKPEDVIDFWIGDADCDPDRIPARSKLWYGSVDKVDQEVFERFGQSLEQAEQGELEHWKTSMTGKLALVILLDQFTRNLNRGSKDAWRNDGKALEIARNATSSLEHTLLSNIKRVFLYHPFHHAESREAQGKAVRLFEELQKTAAPEWQEPLEGFTNFVKNHMQIIHQFGRFPHRNKALQRESTKDEIEYLTSNTRRYGQ